MSSQLTIIYISSNAHSGSTILDIFLGNTGAIKSVGELNKLSKDSILNEYCSCRKKVENCDFWKPVITDWQNQMSISLEMYQREFNRYERFIGLPRLLFNFIFPSKRFIRYCKITEKIYQNISSQSGKSILVDSSKPPQRILLLRKIFSDLRVIHLTRNFEGVLNSNKKSRERNLEEGVEYSKKPSSTFRSIARWVFTNFLISLYSVGTSRTKIRYKQFIKSPGRILKSDLFNGLIDESYWKKDEMSLIPDHLLAGNRVRMKKEITINSSSEGTGNLNMAQKNIAKVVETFFWFW